MRARWISRVAVALLLGSSLACASADRVTGPTPPPPVRLSLRVASQPKGSVSGQPLAVAPTVQVIDNNGTLVAATGSATISIASGPGQLEGTVTVPVQNGQGTFNDLRVRGDGKAVFRIDGGSLGNITTDTVFTAAPVVNLTTIVQVQPVTDSTARVVLPSDTTATRIRVGDVITSTAGEGMLARVTAVQQSNNQVAVDTKPASLAEVGAKGTLRDSVSLGVTSLSIDSSATSFRMTGVSDLSMQYCEYPHSLAELKDALTTIKSVGIPVPTKVIDLTRLDFSFAPILMHDINLDDGLKSLDLKLGGDFTASVSAKLLVHGAGFSTGVDVLECKFPNIKTAIITPLGPIPVIMTPIITAGLKLSYSSDFTGPNEITATARSHVLGGVNFDRSKPEGQQLSKTNELTVDADLSLSSGVADPAPESLKLSAYASGYLKLYGAVGPYVSPSVFVKAARTVSDDQLQMNSVCSWGFGATGGIKLDIFHAVKYTLSLPEWTAFEREFCHLVGDVRGAISISQGGLPNGTTAPVTVTGPNGFAWSGTGSKRVLISTAGTYAVATQAVTLADARICTPDATRREHSVALGQDVPSTFTFSCTAPPPSTLALSVSPATVPPLQRGESATFTVTVTANASAVSGATVPVLDNVSGQSTSVTTGANGQATYTVTVPTNKTAGTYTVVFGAATKGGFTPSGQDTRAVTVTVPDGLALTVTPTEAQTLLRGASAVYAVSVTANGSAVSGVLVPITDNVSGQSTSVTTGANGQASYTVTVPSSKAIGTYTVVFGAATKSGYTASGQETRSVTVDIPNPLVVTQAASNKTSTSLTMNGTVNPQGQTPVDYWFEYALNTSTCSPFTPTTARQLVNGATTPVGVTDGLSGLTPGMTISYRLVAARSGGSPVRGMCIAETLGDGVLNVIVTRSPSGTVTPGTSVSFAVTVLSGSAPLSSASVTLTSLPSVGTGSCTTNTAGQCTATIALSASATSGTKTFTVTASKTGYVTGSTTHDVTVSVPDGLALTVTPTAAQTLLRGASTTYTVSVTANANAVSGVLVPITDNVSGQSTSVTTSANGQASYTVTVPSSKAVGAYTVVFGAATKSGYTASGQESRSVTVTIPDPVVVTQAASSVTSTSLTMNGTVNPQGQAPVDYWFEYAVNTTTCSPFTPTGIRQLVNGATTPVGVTDGLSGGTPGMVISYRLAAARSGGSTVRGNCVADTLASSGLTVSVVRTPSGNVLPGASLSFAVTVTSGGSAVPSASVSISSSPSAGTGSCSTNASGQCTATVTVPTSATSGTKTFTVSATKTGYTTGSTTHDVVVAIPDPIVVTQAASSVTSTSLTMNGTVNPQGQAPVDYWFEYAVNTTTCSPFTPTGIRQLVNGATTPVGVTDGLSGGTSGMVISYRLAAARSGGGTVRGDCVADTLSSNALNVSVTRTPSGTVTPGTSLSFAITVTSGGSAVSSASVSITSSPSAGTASCTTNASGQCTGTIVVPTSATNGTKTFTVTASKTGYTTGSTTHDVVVSIPDPIVVTQAATSKTSTSLTMNGTVNPQGQSPVDYWFEYAVNSSTCSPFTPTGVRQLVNGATTPVGVTDGLSGGTPGMTISYRLAAARSGGSTIRGTCIAETLPTSGLSVSVTRTPSGTVAPGASLSFAVTVTSGGSAVSSASVSISSSPSAGTGSCTTNSSGQCTATVTVPTSTTAGTKTYTVAASKAGYTNGSTTHDVVVSIPDPIVVTQAASSKTSTSLTMNGTVNPQGQSPVDYWFEYAVNSSTCSPFTPTGVRQLVNGATTAVGVTDGLSGGTPGMTISYRLAAARSGGSTIRGSCNVETLPTTALSVSVTRTPSGTVAPGASLSFAVTVTSGGSAVSSASVSISSSPSAGTGSCTTNSSGQCTATVTVPTSTSAGAKTFTVSATKSGYTSGSTTHSVTVGTPSLSVTVSRTPSGNISPGTAVDFTVTVTDGSNAVSSASVSVTSSPNVGTASCTTGTNGQCTARVTVPTSTSSGTYTFTITASKSGYNSGSTTHNVTVQTGTGSLSISWTGLPAGISPGFSIYTSGGAYVANCGTSYNPCTINSLAAGSYDVRAFTKTVSGSNYVPSPTSQIVTVTAGQTKNVSVTFTKQ